MEFRMQCQDSLIESFLDLSDQETNSILSILVRMAEMETSDTLLGDNGSLEKLLSKLERK